MKLILNDSVSDYTVPTGLGDSQYELERVWNKMVMANLRYYCSICLEKLRKTMKNLVRIVTVLLKIQTDQKCYSFSWLSSY
jgi:hypothetical protein